MNPEQSALFSSRNDAPEPAVIDAVQFQEGRKIVGQMDGGVKLAQIDSDTAKQLLHPKHQGLLASDPAHTHRWEFVHVIGRRRAGLDQAAIDAINLKDAANIDFVDRISEDCHVGPHLESIEFLGGALGKGAVKGWILKSAGEYLGPWAKWTGLGSGVALGAIGGAYFAYESSELMENSCKVANYEKRFEQGISSGTTTADPEETSPLGPLNLPYGIEKNWPSVREVLDNVGDSVAEKYYFMRNKPRPDSDVEIFKQVRAKAGLDDQHFMSWAKDEAKLSFTSVAKSHIGFLSGGAAGGAYTLHKLKWELPSPVIFHEVGNLKFAIKNPRSALVLGTALVGAFLLSELGVKAREATNLAELYTARLVSKPHDHPNH